MRENVARRPKVSAHFKRAREYARRDRFCRIVGDLLEWAASIAIGQQKWHDSEPLPWEQGVARFFAALKDFDNFLASSEPVQVPMEKLFQGPIADALSHVGQIALRRRMAGTPVKGENYYVAEIVTGRVGVDQARPKREF